MLKSTYTSAQAPLLPGWTEHKAPSGHLYYYNADTKKSTYTRPIAAAPEPQPDQPQPIQNGAIDFGALPTAQPFQGVPQASAGWHGGPQQGGHGQHQHREPYRRPQPQDKPKHKQAIPSAAPWILVKTKLRRRFVHNTETGESLWKFPADVMKCVVEMDRVERERKSRHAKGDYSDKEEDEKVYEPPKKEAGEGQAVHRAYDSDEYEEVEVTDDEGQYTKRQKTDEAQPGPLEFDEDDIAFQLAQMEQLADADDYENGEPYEEAPELAEEDAQALFADLLNDHNISPFTQWDKIIEEGRIIEDDRYTVLPNMKSRKEAFDSWSRVKAQELKQAREQQAKQDPRVPFMAFLDQHATPKLYWPEFRRKYQKEAEMKDRKLTDKDREKWYREHISRLKLPESKLKSDLSDLLKSIPVRELNKSSSVEALPSSLLRDIRYITLPSKKRQPLIEAFVATAAPAPGEGEALSAEEEAERARHRIERERREKALADRVDAVRVQKARQRRELGYSKAVLQETEAEIERAKQVGKSRLADSA